MNTYVLRKRHVSLWSLDLAALRDGVSQIASQIAVISAISEAKNPKNLKIKILLPTCDKTHFYLGLSQFLANMDHLGQSY